MEILRCEGLCVSYDAAPVIQNASFTIEAGDYVLVVGENGSGKSTLVKTILGLVSPSSGKLTFTGGLTKTEIGYLAQQSDTKRDFPASVFEVVLSGFCGKRPLLPFYTKEQKRRADEALSRLGMDAYKKRPFSTLSGGQRQRVLLARALCATQKLILCDEPAAGLDARVTAQLYDAIRQLNRDGITVIMVTHDLSEALPDANKVIHMGRDQTWCLSKEEYKKSEMARSLFGPLTESE